MPSTLGEPVISKPKSATRKPVPTAEDRARSAATMQKFCDLLDWKNWLNAWDAAVRAQTGQGWTGDLAVAAAAESRLIAQGYPRPEVEMPERLRSLGPFASR